MGVGSLRRGAKKEGVVGTLVRELIKTLRPALVSFITAGVTAKTATENEPPDGNGNFAGPPPVP